MTKTAVLKKAFKKAAKNGYRVNIPKDQMRGEIPMEDFINYGIHYKILFNHDFAKSFFIPKFNGKRLVIKPEYYLDKLAEMAREKDPIKYLAKHI